MRTGNFNPNEIANLIVNKFMMVKDRELIWIECGKHNIEFAQKLAIEIAIAGGFPIIEAVSQCLKTKKYKRGTSQIKPKSGNPYDKIEQFIDGYIILHGVEDPATLLNSPIGLFNSISRAIDFEHLRLEPIKKICLTYPTPKRAKFYDYSYRELSQSFWGAMYADQAQMEISGRKIEEALTKNPIVKIESENGTSLTFSCQGRSSIIETGKIEISPDADMFPFIHIPAGCFYTSAIEYSAEGVIRVNRTYIKGRIIEDLMIRLKAGSIVEYSAGSGQEAIKEVFERYGNLNHIFSSFGIGLNPLIKRKFSGLVTLEYKTEGVTSFAIGRNIEIGGNYSQGMRRVFMVPDATVMFGKKIIIEKGKLLSTFK